MKRIIRAVLVGPGLALALAGASAGQTTPASPPAASPPGASPSAPAPSPGANATRNVTVQASRPDAQREIDRKSYSLAADQQAATGSLADVLRNLPGVDVSPQGQISIRGDSNVTILVDGQPSPLFQGPGRAQLLQQLPANMYERAEVMTNPSAAFRPEGSGGIINLITKKRSKPGREESISARAVSTDGASATARGVYTTAKYTLSGALFASGNRVTRNDVSTRQLVDPASGETADVGVTSHLVDPYAAWGFTGAASYQLDPATRLLADLNYAHSTSTGVTSTDYRSSALTGVLAQDYDERQVVNPNAVADGGSVSLVRTYKGDDHNLTLRVGYSGVSYSYDDVDRFDYQLPVQPDLFQDLSDAVSHRQIDLKAEYKAPLSPTSRLDIGYDGAISQDTTSNLDRLGEDAADLVVDPALDHAFSFDQSVQALFATYQTRFGKLTIMPGLRLEEVGLDIADAGAASIRRDYFELYPTFHLNYALTDRIDLSASYSRRVQRPTSQELDPFRTYANPLSFSEGNPLLAPEITDSYEVEAAYTKGVTYFTADLFFRDHKDLVSNVTETLGGGALLTTYVNAGHSRDMGLELGVNRPLTPHLTFNLSTDLFWNQLDVPPTPFERPTSGAVVLVRPKLNWDITKKDFAQITLYARSRTPTLQGYSGPIVYMAAGFRHKFDDRLSLDLTTIDPFDTLRVHNVIRIPNLTQVDNLNLHQQSVSIGLTVALGPHPKAGPRDFDFGAAAAPGAAAGGGAPAVGGAPAN